MAVAKSRLEVMADLGVPRPGLTSELFLDRHYGIIAILLGLLLQDLRELSIIYLE